MKVEHMKQDETHFENAAFYSFGRVQSQLEQIAASLNVPVPALTLRVCELLSSAAGGQVLGAEDSMPALRSNAASRGDVRRTALAVVGGTHPNGAQRRGPGRPPNAEKPNKHKGKRRRRMSREARKRLAEAMRARWASHAGRKKMTKALAEARQQTA